MKKSYYNFNVKDKNNILLYNSLNGTSVILNESEFNDFNNFCLNEETTQTLKQLGFYVENEENELKTLFTRNRMITENSKNLSLRIFTTTKCNAKCFYCYEKGAKTFDMTEKTALEVCSFIKNKLIGKKSLSIQWFGGEPLLNYNIIDFIINNISPFLQENKIAISSTMISNGYLFNDEIINKAKTLWNLKSVQITLDGLKNTYEKIKQYNKTNAFEKVIENIHLLTNNKIKVNIRLNYSFNNFKEILSLIEYLAKEFNNNAYVNVYAKRLFLDEDKNYVKNSTKMDIKISNTLYKNGFIKNIMNSLKPISIACMASNLNNFVINADGTLLKCARALNNKNFGIVGNIENNKLNNNLSFWCSNLFENKCLKCKLLPLCSGGCNMERLLGNSPCFINTPLLKHKLKLFLKNYKFN